MKANVANYIIQEMSSRFPMRSEDVVNADPVSYTHLTLPTNREV